MFYNVPRKAHVVVVALLTLLPVAHPAQAQEMVQGFIDPSFGGNPFNSDHLRAIAELDRPKAPTIPSSTPEQLLVSQLQASLNATVSSNILRDIQNATVGQSGSYTLGDTLVTFTRSATATTVTFVNSSTGETRTIVVPVPGALKTSGTSAVSSAERTLAATNMPSLVSPFSQSLAAEGDLLLAPPPL